MTQVTFKPSKGVLPRCRCGYTAALVAFLLASGSAVAWAEEPQTMAPGSVVRWPGDGLTGCSAGGRSWQPLDGACLYGIDLLATGTLRLGRTRAGEPEELRVRVGSYPYDVQELHIEDDSRVHLSEADLARVGRENRRIGALWHRGGARRFQLPLAAPLEPLPPSGRFGAKRIINGEPRRPHTGADYAAASGTPVRAVEAGVVALAEEHFFAGNSVFIDHGDGLVSMHFHLRDLAVEKDQEIDRGETLGTVGATGRATGPHLHFGLRWHGARIDPAALLGSPGELPRVGEP